MNSLQRIFVIPPVFSLTLVFMLLILVCSNTYGDTQVDIYEVKINGKSFLKYGEIPEGDGATFSFYFNFQDNAPDAKIFIKALNRLSGQGDGNKIKFIDFTTTRKLVRDNEIFDTLKFQINEKNLSYDSCDDFFNALSNGKQLDEIIQYLNGLDISGKTFYNSNKSVLENIQQYQNDIDQHIDALKQQISDQNKEIQTKSKEISDQKLKVDEFNTANNTRFNNWQIVLFVMLVILVLFSFHLFSLIKQKTKYSQLAREILKNKFHQLSKGIYQTPFLVEYLKDIDQSSIANKAQAVGTSKSKLSLQQLKNQMLIDDESLATFLERLIRNYLEWPKSLADFCEKRMEAEINEIYLQRCEESKIQHAPALKSGLNSGLTSVQKMAWIIRTFKFELEELEKEKSNLMVIENSIANKLIDIIYTKHEMTKAKLIEKLRYIQYSMKKDMTDEFYSALKVDDLVREYMQKIEKGIVSSTIDLGIIPYKALRNALNGKKWQYLESYLKLEVPLDDLIRAIAPWEGNINLIDEITSEMGLSKIDKLNYIIKHGEVAKMLFKKSFFQALEKLRIITKEQGQLQCFKIELNDQIFIDHEAFCIRMVGFINSYISSCLELEEQHKENTISEDEVKKKLRRIIIKYWDEVFAYAFRVFQYLEAYFDESYFTSYPGINYYDLVEKYRSISLELKKIALENKIAPHDIVFRETRSSENLFQQSQSLPLIFEINKKMKNGKVFSIINQWDDDAIVDVKSWGYRGFDELDKDFIKPSEVFRAAMIKERSGNSEYM